MSLFDIFDLSIFGVKDPEDLKKRAALVQIEQDKKDDIQRRAILKAPYDESTKTFKKWNAVPEVLPRIYQIKRTDAKFDYSLLCKAIYNQTGIPFSTGNQDSEFEHMRWKLTEYYSIAGAATVPFLDTGMNHVQWRVLKDLFPKMAEFVNGIAAPVSMSYVINRNENAEQIESMLQIKSHHAYATVNLSPACMWDVMRDSPDCLTLRIVYVTGSFGGNDAAKVLLSKFTSTPPNPWYIIEVSETNPNELLDTEHLRILTKDLIVNSKSALKMVRVLNDMGGVKIPIDRWIGEFDQEERDRVSPKCTVHPVVEFKSPWSAKDTLINWPLEYSIHLNFPQLASEIYQGLKVDDVAKFVIHRIRQAWAKFLKPSGYSKDLTPYRRDFPHAQQEFYSFANPSQETAELYAKYMHFPPNSRHFHLILEFGFLDSQYKSNEKMPYDIRYMTDEFFPDILFAPSPQIALGKKLEKQGQLLRVRCFQEHLHEQKFIEGFKYKIEFDGSVSFVDDDEILLNTICTRIARAQLEQVQASKLLSHLSDTRPRTGIRNLSPLIKSYLGGKYCHNPGCDKETTVMCGHCDNTGYCSSDCAGKHWPTHQ